MRDLLAKAVRSAGALSCWELKRLLVEAEAEELFAAARAVKLRECGRGIAPRGLIEIGNVCAKDCLYCGIRKGNRAVRRYALTPEEIFSAAAEAKRRGYESIVLQGGEIESAAHTEFVESVLLALKPLELGITISLGEQSEETYRRWREAGAARYLLRIETSDPDLYARIHPAECSWERRRHCLELLRALDYQVGTGTMSALPGQTPEQLARDIDFFRAIDADMIGMGPYIPAAGTPLAKDSAGNGQWSKAARLRIGLRMIAVTRLQLHDVNIAASTALEALAENGRELGVQAGANVVMPNVSSVEHRADYRLYDGKPDTSETDSLELGLRALDEELLYGRRGDPLHYERRIGGC